MDTNMELFVAMYLIWVVAALGASIWISEGPLRKYRANQELIANREELDSPAGDDSQSAMHRA